jgi:hypothetical protein
LRITPESKSIILKRIAEVADYFVTKYNESIADLESIEEAHDYYSNDKRFVKINNFSYEINSLVRHATITVKEPTLKGVKLINVKKIIKDISSLLYGYKKVYYIDYRGRFKDASSPLHYNELSNAYKYTKLGKNKRDYLRQELNSAYLVNKLPYELKLFKNGAYGFSYYDALNLGSYPRSEWRERIKEYQYIRSLLIGRIKDADEIEVPQAWLDARKPNKVKMNTKAYKEKNGKRVRVKGSIIVKEACNLERFVSGSNCKFESNTYDLAKIASQPCVFIYTKHEDSKKLDRIYKEFSKWHHRMNFITLSDRELRAIEGLEIHNLISYEKFMKGEHKYYRSVVTAYLIEKLRKDNPYVFDKKERLKELSTPLYDKLDRLNKFRNKYHENYSSQEVLEAMLEVAIENDLFDTSIYDEYLEVKSTLEKLKFLDPIMKYMSSYTNNGNDNELFIAMCDLCRYHKFRMNVENYK